MKRYACTVATGLLLALMSTGTATAGLPLPGQSGTQLTSFGDQTVGEQKSDPDVTQAQGNGNLSIAPAIGILGNAETTNAQGNGNTATATVGQSNSVDQSQSSFQKQSLDQDGAHCCGGQSQTGTQKVYGGDQTVEKQRNDADVNQWQGNGNLNIAPAIALLGDAETRNYQGNGNRADADVTQSNSVMQSQSSTQKQELTQDGGGCCKLDNHSAPKKGSGEKEGASCCDGQSQTGEQNTSFGDQYVGKQKHDAGITQKQGNWNGSFAPAIAFGGKKGNSCFSKCESYHPVDRGGATTTNKQGNWNEANATVGQSNSVGQSQTSYQRQSLIEACKGLVYRT